MLLGDMLSPETSTIVATAAFLMQSQPSADTWSKAGQLALGALLGLYIVVQVLERVLPYLRPQSRAEDAGKPKSESTRFSTAVVRYVAALEELKRKVNDLHDWHNVRGPDGMHVWWAPVALLAKVVDAQKDIQTELRELQDRIERLGSGPST